MKPFHRQTNDTLMPIVQVSSDLENLSEKILIFYVSIAKPKPQLDDIHLAGVDVSAVDSSETV